MAGESKHFKDGKWRCGLDRAVFLLDMHEDGNERWYHQEPLTNPKNEHEPYGECHGAACPDKLLAKDAEDRRKDERRVIEAHVRLHHTYPGSLGMNMQFWHPKAEHWLNEQRRTEVDHRHRNVGPPKAQQRVPGKRLRREVEANEIGAPPGENGPLVWRPNPGGGHSYLHDRRIATEPRRQAEREQDGVVAFWSGHGGRNARDGTLKRRGA